MRNWLLVFLLLALLTGCSTGEVGIEPDESLGEGPALRSSDAIRWAWSANLYRVSADHTTVEKLPNRSADYHFNVTPFVEPPNCGDCLSLGNPQIQPDGSMKIKVILRHPFPGQPQYTGFDVRGTVMFPATRFWTLAEGMGWMVTVYGYPFAPDQILPAYFSRAEDGGAQLLNQDGYTLFLSPWLDMGPEFEAPIFNYSKGRFARGPDPDSTINPFILFSNDPERRMFRVTDTITRTYHIDPPDGEFLFGYVVDASWAPPDVLPVTDPVNDFPFYANAEEGYVLDFQQIAPFQMGIYTFAGSGGHLEPYNVTECELYAYDKAENPGTTFYVVSYLLCPEIVPYPILKGRAVAFNFGSLDLGGGLQEIEPGLYSFKQKIEEGTYEAEPGQYTAVQIGYLWFGDTNPFYPRHFLMSKFVDIITLDVIE